MDTIERKQHLLQRLFLLNDEQKLEALEAFMDRQCPDEVLCFSPELRAKVDEALEEMRQGKVYGMADMEQRLAQWSGK